MKKKIILIFLIFSITSLEVKAEGKTNNDWALLKKESDEKTEERNIQIDLYIPGESLSDEAYISQVDPCGTNDRNVFHAILDVKITFHYSYAVENKYYNKIYAGGSFVYDYTINESIWWELDNNNDWSVYLSGNNTCNKGTSIPIGDDIEFQDKYKITTITNKKVYTNDNFNDDKIWNTDLRNNLISKALIETISGGMPTVSITFPNSNDYRNENSANNIGEIESNNTTIEEWLAGQNNAITREFKYKIYDAYIDFRNNANVIYTKNVIDDETGYVRITNDKDVKNLYFVPLNYPSGELKIEATYGKFGLLDINIDDVTTTASVTVTQNLYNDDGSYRINYRPIDVSKLDVTTYIDKIARYKNWNDWLKQDGNQYDVQNVNRIRDSYSRYPDGYDYKVSFSGKSDFNSDWNYSDWTNINQSGSSNFLLDNSNIDQLINTTENYCEIGEFSDGCNKRNN